MPKKEQEAVAGDEEAWAEFVPWPHEENLMSEWVKNQAGLLHFGQC